MAEFSEDTKAIIDRLKAEGDLLRNSGTNSIRSVKIEMAKFESVFNTISANIVEQTKILQIQAGLAQEAVESQRTKEQFDEVQQEKEQSNTTENTTNKKIDDMGDKIEKSISDALSIRSILGGLKDAALIGGGLFVGYNLVKGFINDQTNGGFDRMEESISNFDLSVLSTLPTTLGNLNTTLGTLNTNLSSLTESIAGLGPLADKILQSISDIAEAWWWKAILVAGAGLATALIQARTRIGTMPKLPTGLPGASGGLGAGGKSFLGRLGGFLGGALRIGGAALTVGTIIDLDAENQAAFEENGAQGVRDLQERRQNNMMDNFESTPVLSQLISGYNSLYEFVHGEPAPRTTFDAERRDQEQSRMDAYAEYGQSRVEGERLAREAAEQARIDALSEEEYQAEAIQEEIGYLQGEITKLNQMMGNGVEHPQVEVLRGQIEDLEEELLQYRNPAELTFESVGGGRGQSFERAGERQRYLESVALEALIEAQRQSNDSRETLQREMTAIESYLARIEEGASSNGSTVIVNAPTNVSPVVNNVTGGKSVSQVSIRGGGGADSGMFGSSNPYGLPLMTN